jgi:hypothetical protein
VRLEAQEKAKEKDLWMSPNRSLSIVIPRLGGWLELMFRSCFDDCCSEDSTVMSDWISRVYAK